MFKMTDDGVNWKMVTESRVRRVFSKVYEDGESLEWAVNELKRGTTLRSAVGTFYRWKGGDS